MVSQISLQRMTVMATEGGKKPVSGGAESNPRTPLTTATQSEPASAANEATALAPADTEIDDAALETAVRSIEGAAKSLQRSLQFSIDEVSGRTVITVIDKATDKVIRQIPGEEILSLADHFEGGRGALVEAKV